jgi:hypothetical protein
MTPWIEDFIELQDPMTVEKNGASVEFVGRGSRKHHPANIFVMTRAFRSYRNSILSSVDRFISPSQISRLPRGLVLEESMIRGILNENQEPDFLSLSFLFIARMEKSCAT